MTDLALFRAILVLADIPFREGAIGGPISNFCQWLEVDGSCGEQTGR